jgi:hypothetical protein
MDSPKGEVGTHPFLGLGSGCLFINPPLSHSFSCSLHWRSRRGGVVGSPKGGGGGGAFPHLGLDPCCLSTTLP